MEQVETAIACAKRDCVVNPQFAGGLQPIIEILEAALLVALPREPERPVKTYNDGFTDGYATGKIVAKLIK